jgi:hypothetical protein
MPEIPGKTIKAKCSVFSKETCGQTAESTGKKPPRSKLSFLILETGHADVEDISSLDKITT